MYKKKIKTNAFIIQENLKKKEYVTIPEIQCEYNLIYGEAKEFVEQLIARCWVNPVADGIKYYVKKDNLCLRKISPDEVDGFIDDITDGCVLLLNYIYRKSGVITLHSDLIDEFGDEESSEKVMDMLLKHKLIHLNGEYCLQRVSKRVVSALHEMSRRRRIYERTSEKRDAKGRLRAVFNVLFDS